MADVIVPVSLGGSGLAYTDGTGTRGMASKNGYGFASYLFPMLSEVMAACQIAVDSVPSAQGSANAASASATLAQNWATKTDGEVVVGQGYGAKKYSDDAAGHRAAAALSETNAQNFAAAAATGAKFFDTIALGNAGVADGATFGVKAGGGDNLMRPTVYRRDSAGVSTMLYAVQPATEYDTMRQELGGTGVMTDKGPLVLPLTVNNLTDATAISTTVTPEAGGVRINQVTSSRLVAYSALLKTGGARTRIKQTIVFTSAGASAAAGLSFGSGGSRRSVVYWADGSIRSMLGEDTVLTNDVQGGSTFTTGDTVAIEYLWSAGGALTVSASKNGGKPVCMGYEAVPSGEVALAVNTTTNCVHSFEISSVSSQQKSAIDRVGAESGLSSKDRLDLIPLVEALTYIFNECKVPAGSGIVPPADFRVFRVIGQRRFVTNIRLKRLIELDDPRNVVIYVDGVGGLDTNPGTSLLPLKTMPAALGAVKKCPYATIMVKGGDYFGPASAWDSTNHVVASKLFQVISWDGTPVNMSPHLTGLVWTETGIGTNTYSADCSAYSYFTTYGCGGVLDSKLSRRTVNGDFEVLAAAASQAACESTPGTFFRSASTIFVHAADNRAPDSDIRVFMAQWGSGSYGVAAGTIYLEGIQFEGGNYPFRIIGSSTTNGITLYAKDCAFRHGFADDALNFVAVGVAVLQRCVAARAFTDGFSYTTYSTGAGPLAVEIDCTSRDNGRTTAQTNQGSTMHSGGTAIRVNGTYYDNQHANIHDVTGSKSWMLGVTARDPKAATAVCNIGSGQSTGDTTVAYMDTCTTTGFATDLIVGGAAYYYDHVGIAGTIPVKSGAGTLSAYTPT